jgi:uncharacterized membrane protein SirB2
MQAIHFSLLLHLVAFGILSSAIVGGWILNAQYFRALDYGAKLQVLRQTRPFGLLSPLSIVLFLLSGIGNMVLGGRGYTIFSESWLTAKIVIFLVVAAIGIFSGIRSKQRTRLVEQMALGKTPHGSAEALNSLDIQQRWFLIIQTLLILIILTLSVSKPHA